jgi:hypothetical protein
LNIPITIFNCWSSCQWCTFLVVVYKISTGKGFNTFFTGATERNGTRQGSGYYKYA